MIENKKNAAITDEALFFEGPRSRWREFVFAVKVLFQFIKGFRKFHFLGPCATVFGSARYEPDQPYYEITRKMGQKLATMGFTVMTGGGPGLMEAANRGAKEAGGKSVGCNIVLPTEQQQNKYLDRWVEINYFFIRKVLLSKYSYVFIVMPGGYGTLDEFFESLTLIQTHKSRKFPVILMGKNYHSQLIGHINSMVDAGTISREDGKLFLFTDDINEAINHIETHAIKQYNLRKRGAYRPIRMFGER
ncbi:MAG TPA: TIGR00730 family Rossman fold protein [Flavobacteriales bacterium]|nr:TIGR00730 family Rossman fold protein [Flavobacteriales bacterium]